jgi:outer membrane lipase/esterase
MMRRLRVITSTLLVVGSLFLTNPTPSAGQALNDVLVQLLSNNCAALGSFPPSFARGPLLDKLCQFPPTLAGSGSGATTLVESRIGDSEEQRRQARRLAERRAGGGGSADEPGTGFGVFVNGDYQFLRKDTTRFETGFEQNTAGTTVGVDYSFRGRAVLGVAINYAHEFGDYAGVAGGFDNDVYGISLYGTVSPIDNLFVDMFVGYTRKEYSFDRRVNFEVAGGGGLAGIPSPRAGLGRIDGDTNSDEVHAGVTLGYDFVLGKFTIGPRVGVNYRDMGIAGYREHGSTGIELIYDHQSIVSLTTTAGLFASMAINTGFGVLVPQATAEYVHEFAFDQRRVGFTLLYSTFRPKFFFQTDPPDRDFVNVALGTVLVLPGGMSVYANVRELLGYNTRTATTVTAGLRVAF